MSDDNFGNMDSMELLTEDHNMIGGYMEQN